MTRSASKLLALLATAVIGVAGVSADPVVAPLLARFQIDTEPSGWKLPKKLDEISGLATTADGRLIAHEDQNGIVYEIDREEGRLVKAFAMGKPTVTGDFEGIAVAEDRVYLITSQGRLYETREADDGERTRFNTYDTEADAVCLEVEGLAYIASEGVLAIACKHLLDDRDGAEEVWILRWSLERRLPLEPIRISAERLVADKKGSSKGANGAFRATAIEWDPASNHLLVLSSKPPSLAEVTLQGEVLGVRKLESKRHRQAEGLTFASGTALLVADEGAGRRPRLSLYPALDRGSPAGAGEGP